MALSTIEGTQERPAQLDQLLSNLFHTTRNTACHHFANCCERGGSVRITPDDFEHEKDDANGKSDNPDGGEPH
jgi:hypothetical protein